MAKLELLMLKWAMTEKLWNYLLGSKCTVYKDNNPLAYVRDSKLRAAQIRWLSKLTLFDIKCRGGKSNKAVDTLSHYPFAQGEMDSASDSEEHETITYASVCGRHH